MYEEPIYPTADQIARAIVTACALTHENPLMVASPGTLRARQYAFHALTIVFPQITNTSLARCVGYRLASCRAARRALLRSRCGNDADSLLMTRNLYDMQVRHINEMTSYMLLEAVTSRIAALNGPMGAAIRAQRVADICATAHVLLIDHWKAADLPLPAPAQPAPTSETNVSDDLDAHGGQGECRQVLRRIGYSLGVIVASWK